MRSPSEGVPEKCFEDRKPEHSNIPRERFGCNRGKREAGEVGRRWRAKGPGSQMNNMVLTPWQASGAACPYSWKLFRYLLHFYKI